MEKLYRVQMNSKGMPDFSTAVEAEDKPSVDKDYLMQLIQEAVYDGEACSRLLDLVDRPQGEWIHNPNGIDRDFIWWKCSNCGHVIFSETEHDREQFHAFCGRCGAKMKGVDDETL